MSVDSNINYLAAARYSSRRFLARTIDFFLIYLIYILSGSDNLGYYFGALLLYNFLFCLLNGLTIGRLLCWLKFQPTSYLRLKLLKREALFWLLGWAIFFELIFSEKPYFHDRLSGAFITISRAKKSK